MDDDITGSLHLLGEADGLIQFVKVVDTLSVDRSRKRDNRETPLNKTSSVCWNNMKLHIIEFEFKNLAIEISRKKALHKIDSSEHFMTQHEACL